MYPRKDTDICSDWELLRKLSQKRVTEALEQQGVSSQEISGIITKTKLRSRFQLHHYF